MPPLEILAFVVGIIYGFLNPGKEDRIKLLKKAIVIGIGIGLIIGAIAAIFLPIIGIFIAGAGIIAFTFLSIYLAIFFILGSFIGDMLERAIR
jgi:Na+/phosphate symporter